MKVVINKCFGGFSLSRKAVKRMADLQGRECYFFTHFSPDGQCDIGKHYPAQDYDGDGLDMFWSAFDIPNPNDVLGKDDDWNNKSQDQRDASNTLHSKHHLSNRPDDRTDPLLIRVIEELGKDANGACAELEIIEIPDGIEYTIEEYDGSEHIAEAHRTWS